MTNPIIVIVSGPGGAGKGTIVEALIQRDSTLWLSRSWTTRIQRDGESDEAFNPDETLPLEDSSSAATREARSCVTTSMSVFVLSITQ